MDVILISGKAFNGKDSSANILKRLLERDGKRVLITHYGDLVKYVCERFWGWNGEKDEIGRTILQNVGTEIVRSKYPDYWVSFVKMFVELSKDKWDYVLIPDCRMVNEVYVWRNTEDIDYITLRIERPEFKSPLTKEQQLHLSEVALDDYDFDYTITANNMIELEDEVVKFYTILKGEEDGR